MKANDKSPSQLKKEQHERYDEQALLVSRGELGYIPAPKSKYSKTSFE